MASLDSTPIVLIPGLTDSPRLYQDQLPTLFRFGPVSVGDHTRDETIAGIAARVLRDAPPRFALVGLSMGGYTALEIMRQAPERVLRLALLDTSARPETAETSERRRLGIANAQQGKYAEVVEASWPLMVHESHLADAELKRVFVSMHLAAGPEVYVRQQRAIMTRVDSRPSLAAIRCPSLVLVGEGDKVTPVAVAEELANGIAGCRLEVIPECGHLSALEQPEAVTSALTRWLES
jgi:pimeloyl-ACP methyl ester carboxylesterase